MGEGLTLPATHFRCGMSLLSRARFVLTSRLGVFAAEFSGLASRWIARGGFIFFILLALF